MSKSVKELLERCIRRAVREALDVDADPEIAEASSPTFGDYQVNGLFSLARVLRRSPRELAERIAAVLDTQGVCRAPEVAGAGFINLRLEPAWIRRSLLTVVQDERCGVPLAEQPRVIVVDFSSPNVAKAMHIGHLRSTILGDALVRVLRMRGHRVIGDNHVGDWGTQFGAVLWAWKHQRNETAAAVDPTAELERLYKVATEAARGNPAVADACRAELASLQRGEPENRALWERFVAISRADAERVYERLGVSFDTWLGESFYDDRLPGLVQRLQDRGIAKESDGALVVFFPAESGLGDAPYIVRKSDGAFLYSTTDIATVEHRVETYRADSVIYVVDVRQSLHFRQLFATARMLGVTADLHHVGFGMMLGSDGRPFRTRAGGTVSLESLLDEAEQRVLPIVKERWPEIDAAEQRTIAAQVGIGALKYADLCQNLESDYRFEWDKMLAADGNTGPYLQYTLVRIRSVLRAYEARFGAPGPDMEELRMDSPVELELAAHVLRFRDVLSRVETTLRPHFLCEYLYSVARRFNGFYAEHPIVGAEDPRVRLARGLLCVAVGRVMELGLQCLNIPQLARM